MQFTDYSFFLFILSSEGIWTQTFICPQPSISFIHSSIKSMRFCEQVINGREKVEKSFADNFFRIDESFMFLVAVIDLFIHRPVWILFSATLNIFWMSCNDDTKAKVEMINSDIESKGEKKRKKEETVWPNWAIFELLCNKF